MNKQHTPVLIALTLAASALAQTMPDTMMKAAPTFMFSADQGMNMMMSGGAVGIAQVPGEKLISRSVKGTAATLVYSGKNSAAIFSYYDKALGAEGWKTTMMDGKMMAADSMNKPAETMAKPADTMAKPADAMAKPAGTMGDSAMMMGGSHSATFAQGGHTIDLNVREAGGRVTVTFKSK